MKVVHKISVILICFCLSFPWMSAGITFLINEEQHNFCEKIEFTGNEVELEDKADEIIFDYPSIFDLTYFFFSEHYNKSEKPYYFNVKQSHIEIVSPPPEA